jgi:hypothetical protein
MNFTKTQVEKAKKALFTLQKFSLNKEQKIAIKELDSVFQSPFEKTYPATDKELTMKILERTTGINCVELLKDGITKMMEFWEPGEGTIEPDEWLMTGLTQLNQSLWIRLESSHRFFIDLLILSSINHSEYKERLNVCVGEKREYVGEIVDGKRITLTCQNDYDIGYTNEHESRTFLIEAKQGGFQPKDEVELLAQMSIIFGIRKEIGKKSPGVYGALAKKDQWTFYIIQDNGTVYKSIDYKISGGKLPRILFILNSIITEMVTKSRLVTRENSDVEQAQKQLETLHIERKSDEETSDDNAKIDEESKNDDE